MYRLSASASSPLAAGLAISAAIVVYSRAIFSLASRTYG